MARRYDEIASVQGGRIVGETSGRTYSNLRDMHYGTGKFCTGPVELPPITEREFGFVYCTEDNRCVIDWFICHNISQLDRSPDTGAESQPASVTRTESSSTTAYTSPDIGEYTTPYQSGGYEYTTPYQSGGYGYVGGVSYGYSSGGSSCYCCGVTPPVPEPEPETYLELFMSVKSIILGALENLQGDDRARARARARFKKFTPEQMNEEYGSSGYTPAEILKVSLRFKRQ